MSRIYYLDAMRSILMMLGIVLHAAVVLSDGSWLFEINESNLYNSISDFIHLFRMPAFFIISGFFCHMTLSRYGARLFLKVRIPRILIPLIVTALTLNSLQNYLLSGYSPVEFSLYASEYWLEGRWVSHLWFLISLIYYFFIFTFCYYFFKTIVVTLLNWISWLYLRSSALSLILISIITVLTIKVSYLVSFIVPNNQYDWGLGETLYYCIYFFFGFMAGHNRKVLDHFTQFSWSTIIVTLLVLCSAYWLLESQLIASINTLKLLITSLCSWLLSYFCFLLFKRLYNTQSKFFSYFSEASYSIYLFHHVLIIAYAIVLHQFALPYWLMFLLLMLITFITTVIIHHFIINRLTLLKLLFNGKR